MDRRLKEAFVIERDKPYAIPFKDVVHGNSCVGKHIRLKDQLKKLGVESRYRIVTYKWSDFDLPESVLQHPHNNDASHVYLEAFIGTDWITVDATWDSALSKHFSVNELQDNGTSIAVAVIDTLSIEESESIMNDVLKNANEEVHEVDFLGAFNSWLEELRG